MGDCSSNKNHVSERTEIKKGSLIEINDPGSAITDHHGAPVATMSSNLVPASLQESRRHPSGFCYPRFIDASLKCGSIGLFVGFDGPFDQALVLIEEKTYLVDYKFIRVLTHEDWVARQNK